MQLLHLVGLISPQVNKNSIPDRGGIFLMSTAFLSSLGFTKLLPNGYGGNFPRDYAAKICVQNILIQEISRRSRNKGKDNMKKEPKNKSGRK